MSASLERHMSERAERLARFIERQLVDAPTLGPGHKRLLDSMRYSLLQEGGKRFRPVLAMMVAEALGQDANRVLPFAAAVECIHTYSLIHDDLPAMDDDDFRRGQPTNHKKFDEATAILAGDALLTYAFELVVDAYSSESTLGMRVVKELAMASGHQGMVGGQAIDLASKKESIHLDQLRTMHALKTGALIRVAAVGAAILSRADATQLEEITRYAENLGLAFQVADDLLDFDLSRPEAGSYPALLGPDRTRDFLNELTESCLDDLSDWKATAEPLRDLAKYNQSRST